EGGGSRPHPRPRLRRLRYEERFALLRFTFSPGRLFKPEPGAGRQLAKNEPVRRISTHGRTLSLVRVCPASNYWPTVPRLRVLDAWTWPLGYLKPGYLSGWTHGPGPSAPASCYSGCCGN